MGGHDNYQGIPDNSYAPMMKDSSLALHIDPNVKNAVSAARTSLEGFFGEGLDSQLPHLNDALGNSEEANSVKSVLQAKREALAGEMNEQARSVDELHTLMQMSLGLMKHLDSNG